MKEIKDYLVRELQDFFKKANFSKATLGMSGGLDSAVVFALAVDALGKDNVLPVLMPSMYSSQHSVDDSIEMAKNLETKYEIINITNVYNSILESLSPIFNGAPFDVTEENIQARIRGLLLMAISNKQRRLVLNTSNKSELSVGYGTLYGDLCGSISVIGDLYKTEVFELANYINSEKEIIPKNIINKIPSAELRPDQKDTDSLPDYNILDTVLKAYIDNHKDAETIVKEGFDKNIVERIVTLVKNSSFKSLQVPPKISINL
ncbi:NAD(+) synthase [Odoribacter sp. OttesenSCG-928-L07]|nr:NAD(+) synthase [Odoribacter sp. OttesenSCG-928-L07]MDL2239817.1 NAD(+) synthase [Bacteroidales bacterium OttesenSCG-928-L14]